MRSGKLFVPRYLREEIRSSSGVMPLLHLVQACLASLVVLLNSYKLVSSYGYIRNPIKS
jgi:hypothetical protein